MKILGFEITKAAPEPVRENRGGWWPIIRESYAGAWQQNVEVNQQAVLAYHAVFACMTLIASDIAKLRVKLVAQDSDGIWSEVTNPAYSPVLRKPNRYQTRLQFMENWVLSKLSRGNTYILKQRDNRNVVTALYVLDPNRVKPMVSPDGSVYYELQTDNLAGVDGPILVPASEVIHDRFNCLFHPLVGLSPVFANGLSATQGLSIQNHSATLFQKGAQPSGFITVPGNMTQEQAQGLKQQWQDEYMGPKNAGKLVVLTNGMKFESMSMNAVDAQLIEQLKWTAEVVCSTFHVPPYMIGVGPEPAGSVQDRTLRYYSQALQSHLMAMQACLYEGLEMGLGMGAHFDLDGLLLMDSRTQMEVLEKAKSVLTLDERRKRVNVPPITGGDTVYLQQQDHSIEAIAARDKLLIEQAEAEPSSPPPAENDNEAELQAARALLAMTKGLAHV